MGRRTWSAVAAGVLAALLVLGIAGAAFRAGRHHEVVTRTVGDGEVVRVVGDGYRPGPGLVLFPVLGVILVVVLLRGGGRRGGGWAGPGCGPDRHEDAEAVFAHWHQRSHGEPEGTPRT